jgi:hypothetical protein
MKSLSTFRPCTSSGGSYSFDRRTEAELSVGFIQRTANQEDTGDFVGCQGKPHMRVLIPNAKVRGR